MHFSNYLFSSLLSIMVLITHKISGGEFTNNTALSKEMITAQIDHPGKFFYAANRFNKYALETDGNIYVYDMHTKNRCFSISSPVGAFIKNNQIIYADKKTSLFIIKDCESKVQYGLGLYKNELSFIVDTAQKSLSADYSAPYHVAMIDNDPSKVLLSFWDTTHSKKRPGKAIYLIDIEKINSFKPISIQNSGNIYRSAHFFLNDYLIYAYKKNIHLYHSKSEKRKKIKNNAQINGIACDSDHNMLYTVDQKGTINAWTMRPDINDTEPLLSFKNKLPLSSIALHPYYVGISATTTKKSASQNKSFLFFHDILYNKKLFEQELTDPTNGSSIYAQKLFWPSDETLLIHLDTGKIIRITLKKEMFDAKIMNKG